MKSTDALEDLLGRHWHHMPAGEVIQVLETNSELGLDRFALSHRQAEFGPNQLALRKGRSPWIRFLLQFHNPLIYILLAAGATKLAMGGFVDAAVILAVVLINAWIGYLQEAKAERAIEALARSLVTESTVVRAGKTVRVPSTELVPGDVVLLASGDKVPADLRLVATRDLQVAEAALTGESTSVEKTAEAQLGPETLLADRANMVYASTLVTYGQGRGVVVATGDHTEIGRISEMISAAPDLETPLTRKMAAFSHWLLLLILGLAAVVLMVGLVRGERLEDIASSAIALAVGAIPEGLPAAVTVTLAIGVARMARRRAIIRKLPAVETLGSTTVICSDKTGTLTQNQMTVRQVVVGGSVVEVSGNGYEPAGELTLDGKRLAPGEAPGVSECLLAGLLCNDSALVRKDGRWDAQGDPTEVALIVAARKAGLEEEPVQSRWPRVDAIPFESQHQFMATLHDDAGAGRRLVYVKGAVEIVLERCEAAVDANGQPVTLDRGRIQQQVAQLAAAGLRVLAFARAEVPTQTQRLGVRDLPRHFTFLGLQGMMDPPRPEAMDAVAACHRAGIQVKMITGDHAGTAVAVGRQLGLVQETTAPDRPSALTGKELAALSDESLIEVAEQVSVFARVAPEQKLRLVEALQARGHVVAMTGDGVNDGPALKQANIGVAMGITGTEVAKEASDMVLTDDNFASIRAAVEEGRNVLDNLTKIITWALPSNLGQGLVILAAALVGATLPILPLQVLWINMTTGGVLGLFLALEAKEPDLMLRAPRAPKAPILDGRMLAQVVLVGLLILIAAFGLFRWELARGAGIEAARTVALNTVAMIQALYLVNCRSLRHSVWALGLFRNGWLWLGILGVLLLQAGLTYVPFLNAIFQTAPIGGDEWLRILGASLSAMLLVELQKWLVNRQERQP
ncbi:MAG TPA: HAD-IC family P-type ATPase [Verrucomicrobiota bacterium]|nr:HAD-IC family P-type ATPase [Verrucomicrobiota bacterium]HNU52214.1 HAD-IC family P-type ATPase [Verrucomicrobiota bacterium]